MQELKFIGVGSAFNTTLYNTSAFIKENDSLLIIDCGGTTFHRVQELKLLEGVKNLYIIITHTHPDHVGSLGDIVLYCKHMLKQKATIIHPNKEAIEKLLSTIGVGSDVYNFQSLDVVKIENTDFEDINIEFISVNHTKKLVCYGFIMKLKEESFYYSGDSNSINNEIINKLKNGEINRIYQDTCGVDYKGNGHLSLNKLKEIVPVSLRHKVYCIHLDQSINKDEIKDSGFNIGEIYKASEKK